MIRVRFAPSPTGPLHIGGVRTALFNYLFAKKNNGKIILRIEDTDQTRYVKGADEYIYEALKWCGIDFDEGINEGGDFGPYRQSERKTIYQKHVKTLLDSGNAYMAFDSPEELEELRKKAESNGESFLYNQESRKKLNNSLNLSDEDVAKLLEKGTPYVVRFKMPENKEVVLNDIIRGKITVNTKELDDKVLQKTDGLPTYHLANIVDDHLMKISHVIRGEEWLPSLPLHILLYKAFDWKSPQFAHLPLILKPSGKGKLSKRDGDNMGFPVFPIEWKDENNNEYMSFRKQGYLPEACINFLALLGWNPGGDQELFTKNELINSFDLSKVGKSGSRFDPEKAKWFNHKYLIEMSNKDLADKLSEILKEKNIDYNNYDLERICEIIKERIYLLNDLFKESDFFFTSPEKYDEKFFKKAWKNQTDEAIDALRKLIETISEFKEQNIEDNTKQLLQEKQIGFGKVMPALRLALVGEGKGPSVFEIMEIIGKNETINRIDKFLQFANQNQ